MARKNSNFMIGIFVTAGVLLGIAAIIWVGASQYFEEGAFYATYFDESYAILASDWTAAGRAPNGFATAALAAGVVVVVVALPQSVLASSALEPLV